MNQSDKDLINASSHEAFEVWVKTQTITMDKNDYTRVSSVLANTEKPPRSGNAFNNFQRMVSSGYKFDCLIHSIFTSLSPTFRKLKTSNKDIIANKFRREIFKELLLQSYLMQTIPYKFLKIQIKEMIDQIDPIVYLSDLHMRFIVNKYKISIYFFEQGLPGTQWHLMMPYNDMMSAPVIILYNPDVGHFEAIRSSTDDKYIFNIDFLRPFQAIEDKIDEKEVEELRRKENSNLCKPFNTWDIIQDKTNKKRYIVVDIAFTDEKCIAINIIEYNPDPNYVQPFVDKPLANPSSNIISNINDFEIIGKFDRNPRLYPYVKESVTEQLQLLSLEEEELILRIQIAELELELAKAKVSQQSK